MRRSLPRLRGLPPNATAPAHPSYPSSSKYAIPSPDSFRPRGKTSFPPSLGGSPPLAFYSINSPSLKSRWLNYFQVEFCFP